MPRGRTATLALAFTNTHDGPARFSASISGGDFNLDASDVELGPGASTDWRLAFTATQAGLRTSVLRVEVAADEQVQSREIRVDAESVDGPVVTCGPPRFREAGRWSLPDISPRGLGRVVIRCVNRSPLPIEVRDLGLRVEGSVRPSVRSEPVPSPRAPVVLPPFARADWEVELCPRHEGPFNASFVAQTAPSGQPAAAGTQWSGGAEVLGARPSLPEAIVFDYRGGTQGGSTWVHLENIGQDSFELEHFSVTPPFTVTPSVEGQTPTTVPPGGAARVLVELLPSTAGVHAGRVTAVTDVGSLSAPLVARPAPGLDEVPCAAQLELPVELELGVVGSMSSGFTVSLYNPTDVACTVELSTTGMLAPLSSHSRYREWTIAPGAARLLRLEFVGPELPTGAASGTLQLRSRNAIAQPRRLEIRATVDDHAPAHQLRVLSWTHECSMDPLRYELTVTSGATGTSVERVVVPASLTVESTREAFELSPTTCGPVNAVAELVFSDGRRSLLPLGLQPSVDCPETAEPSFQVDRFEMLGPLKVDIIALVDDSGSMEGFAENVRENLNAFGASLATGGSDARILLATSSDGLVRDDQGRAVVERPLDDAFGSLGDRFATLADGTTSRSVERMIDRVIEVAHIAPLRDEAALAVVAISDEPDQSFAPVEQALDELLGIKGPRNTQLFAFSAVGGGSQGCTSKGRTADPDLQARFQTLAARSGGVFATLCTENWHRVLARWECRGRGFKSRFFLTNQPLIETIEVFVDDALVRTVEEGGRINWTYDFSTNSINFTPWALPEPGSDIVVRYVAGCL